MKEGVKTLAVAARSNGEMVFPNGLPDYPTSPNTATDNEIAEFRTSVESDELNHEIVLGAYEYLPFRPDQLVSLSQIRGERNVVTAELKEDILFQGLINPIDVSLVSLELLEEYMRFTNKVWGSEAKIEDYLRLRLPDGRFPLLKSGHSRHAAVAELIHEGKLPEGSQIMTKVSEANSAFDIVQWQRGENIHSQPPRERTAMALVESYVYGLETGQWNSEEKFIAIQKKQGRSVTKGPLDQALKYAKLAPRIRNFILAGEVPYLAGVEMGATMEVLTEYVARSNGYDGPHDPRLEDDDASKRLHKIVEIEMDRICNKITGDNLNSTAAQKVVQARRKLWGESVNMMRPDKKSGEGATLKFEFATDALEKSLAAAQKELRRELADTARKYSGHDIPRFIKLQEGILPEGAVEDLLRSFEVELKHTEQALALGKLGTIAAEHQDDLFG